MYEKRLRVFFIIVQLFFMHSFLHAAPEGKISGFVFDSQSGQALQAANVFLEGTNLGSSTDIDGGFVISKVPVGDYKLVVMYIGYREKTVDISVKEGETSQTVINLDFQIIEGEVISVTAQAEGQISAINQQLSSNTIANIVSEARIRELPDVNAAESIGRLPGISIQRSGGEATKVTIRGLSPKYNTITVNGVRVPATGGVDRSVDLSLISSNMLQGIEVKKAITPDMDADVLGGAVDLRLKEAPEGLQFDATGRWGYNELQDYYGNYNFTAIVSNRFYDGRLGVIGSFNLDNFDRSADKFNGTYREQTNLQGETEIVAQNISMREENVTRGRAGASVVLDYRIPAGKLSAHSFYNRLNWDGLYRINRMNIDNNRHYHELEERGGTTSIFTGVLGMEQKFDWLRYDVSVSRTASRTDNPNENTWQFRQEAGAFTGVNITPDTHPNEIPNFASMDTTLTALAEVFIWDTKREENQTALQLNFEVPFKFGKSINGYLKTGGKFRWLDRMNDVEKNGRDGILYGDGGNDMLTHLDGAIPEWNVQDWVDQYNLLPVNIFLDGYTRPAFLDGEFPLGFTYDKSMMERVTKVLSDSGDVLNYSIDSRANDYEGSERYQAGYLMGEFNLGKHIRLIPGIRYEKDHSEYTGQRFREVTINNIQGPPADLDTLIVERNNEFWLPMVHLQVRPSDMLQIRLARTETLTRPDFIQYAPITRINVFQSYIRAANSLLKPAQSTNYDAAVSVYQNQVGLFTVAGFYKSIKDLIFQTRYDFRRGIPVPEGFNIPQSWLTGAAPQADLWLNNPFESTYKGFELDWQTHFWYLPSLLKGIVLNVNYTRIFSETEKQLFFTRQGELIQIRPPVYGFTVVDSSRTARVPDQPAHIANVTFGYDYKGFSARLSYLYQTDNVTFIDRKPALDNFSGDYARWDLAVKQKITRGLELFANFSNINSREDRNFRGDALTNPTYIEFYGFTMDIGARFKF